MKLIAGIASAGVNFRIVSVYEGDETLIFEFGGVRLYEIPSVLCFNRIKTALENLKVVLFPKNLLNPLTIPDLIIQPALDIVVATRIGINIQARQFISNRTGSLSMFDFYGFSLINNNLIDRGYVFTNDNREQKYLEIVNTGDQDLIDALDIYLTIRDRLDEHHTMYKQYRDFWLALKDMTTVEEMENGLIAFRQLFN